MGIFFAVLFLTYFVFTRKILTYLCESESNAPACYLLSNYYLEKNEISKSNRYLELSCEKKYEYACNKIKR